MKSSQRFFCLVTPLVAITMFVAACMWSVKIASTGTDWQAVSAFGVGTVCMALFTMGMQGWNERMHDVVKARTILFRVSKTGLCIAVISGLCFIAFPTVFVRGCLIVGSSLFVAPIFIASLWGLIRRIADRWYIYCH